MCWRRLVSPIVTVVLYSYVFPMLSFLFGIYNTLWDCRVRLRTRIKKAYRIVLKTINNCNHLLKTRSLIVHFRKTCAAPIRLNQLSMNGCTLQPHNIWYLLLLFHARHTSHQAFRCWKSTFPLGTFKNVSDTIIWNINYFSFPDIRKIEDPEAGMRRYKIHPFRFDLRKKKILRPTLQPTF